MESNNYIQICIDYLNRGAVDACLKELVARTGTLHYVHESASKLLQRLNSLNQDFHSGQIAYSIYEQHRNQIASGARQLLDKDRLPILGQVNALRWPIFATGILLVLSLSLWFVARENEKSGAYYYPNARAERVEIDGKEYLRLERQYYLDIGDTTGRIKLTYQLPETKTASYQLVSNKKNRMALEFLRQNGTIGKNKRSTLEEEEGKFFEMNVSIPSSGLYVAQAYFAGYPSEKEAKELARYFDLSFLDPQGNVRSSATQVFQWQQWMAYCLGKQNLLFVTLLLAGTLFTILLFKFKK